MDKFDEALKKLNDMKEDLQKREENLSEQIRSFEQAQAARSKDTPETSRDAYRAEIREIVTAMKEKRSITLGGTGRVSFVPELVKALQNKIDLINGARWHYGPNSSTVIPVLNPRPALPARQAEGATNIAADATAVLTNTTLLPSTYVSILPISLETLNYSAADLEAELPRIFGDVFAQAILNGMVNGRGATTYSEFDGLFGVAGTSISCAAAGAPTIKDLVNLALRMSDLDMYEPRIVISPTLYAAVTTVQVQGYDVYIEELIRNKTVEGIPVRMTGKAPTATTASSIVAVGCDMARYNIAVGMDLAIEPLKKVGDTNTYFQATMGLDGKPTINSEVFQLTAV